MLLLVLALLLPEYFSRAEERMSPGQWLRSVRSVPFIALTLLVGWNKWRKRTNGELAVPGCPQKCPLKEKWLMC